MLSGIILIHSLRLNKAVFKLKYCLFLSELHYIVIKPKLLDNFWFLQKNINMYLFDY